MTRAIVSMRITINMHSQEWIRNERLWARRQQESHEQRENRLQLKQSRRLRARERESSEQRELRLQTMQALKSAPGEQWTSKAKASNQGVKDSDKEGSMKPLRRGLEQETEVWLKTY